MKAEMKRIFGAGMLTAVLATLTGVCPAGAQATDDALNGWRILRADYDANNWLDMVSFEWVYFMVHDKQDRFVGAIGYILGNPRGKVRAFDLVIPNGGSVAVSGYFAGGQTVSDFITFGLDHTEASGEETSLYGEQPSTGYFAELTPLPGGGPNGEDAFHLEGRTEHFEWDLVATEAWRERFVMPASPGHDLPFTRVKGDDVGVVFPNQEVFNVDSPWPVTNIFGTMTEVSSGMTVDVDGKGYLEDSYGRFILAVDGWDFFVFSTDEEENGVAFVLQTFHKSKKLDYLDFSFEDQGEVRNIRFRASKGELGWRHKEWYFDTRARQCVPNDWVLVAQNKDYRVELTASIDGQQAPFLSNTAYATRVMFIEEQFLQVMGQITRTGTGELVTTFSGQGGGEFALYKSALPWAPSWQCRLWAGNKFSMPLP